MKFASTLLILALTACSTTEVPQEVDAYLELEGNRINYKTSGSGQELIMVHGGYLDLNMWEPQMTVFDGEKKVIRFSDLGHGKSVSSGNKISGYEIIEKLSESTEASPAVLMGLSWGAMICVDYAFNNPQKVSKLILVSPGLSGWDYFQDSLAAQNYQLRKAATSRNDVDSAAILFHKSWVVGPTRKREDLDSDYYDSSLEMISSNMKNHVDEDWSELDSIPAIERLEQLQVPTYIIIGDQDVADIKMIAEQYRSRIPNAKKIIIQDAAHLLNIEQAMQFNEILKQIVNE